MAPRVEKAIESGRGAKHGVAMRNDGSAAGVTLASLPGEPAKRPFEAAMKCWEKGFYVRYGADTLQLGLHFASTTTEIDLLINAMGEAISEID